MRVKINSDSDVYKAILTTNWTSVSPDDAVLAWVVNQALTSAGHPRMFDIDDTADSDALVVLTPAPDGYRGMDALDILYPDVDLKFFSYHNLGDVHAVHRKQDGRLLGYLTTYYGSNGRGRLAAHVFDPAPGVTVRFD